MTPREALARANELDDFFKENNKTVGPFHGLPISVKALIPWEGLRTTEGLAAALANKSAKDASILALIRSLGAVPFVRTTEPQGVVCPVLSLGSLHFPNHRIRDCDPSGFQVRVQVSQAKSKRGPTRYFMIVADEIDLDDARDY